MKRIINLWAHRPEYNCFACAPHNPVGLHMEFFEDGDDIVSQWKPQGNFQGWVDTMHGGILTTLIDEVCGWVVTRKCQTCGFTADLHMRFRRPVAASDPMLTVRAHIVNQVRNLLHMQATITNNAGEVCVEGEVTYFLVSPEKAREMGFTACEVE